mgnify:CR=1 FL=1
MVKREATLAATPSLLYNNLCSAVSGKYSAYIHCSDAHIFTEEAPSQPIVVAMKDAILFGLKWIAPFGRDYLVISSQTGVQVRGRSTG